MKSSRAMAAVLICIALCMPSGLAALVSPSGADAGAGTPPAPPTFRLTPGASMGLRVPDFDGLDSAADKPVAAPAPGRTPLALPGNWTVLVYMVADNDLEPFAIQDLNEMEAALPSAGVSVVVEVDRSSRYDTTNGDWTGTRRYLIRQDGDPSTITSTLLSDLGELNMGDPQTLADFLAWGTDTYPAQHYLVVLWNHGFGWSGGFGNDLGENDHLSLTELSQALEAAAEHLGRPLDILAFDACLMQEVEVAYELAWLADYLVAAQDLEPAAGWPYDAMLLPLYDNPAIAPADLASELVLAYIGFYGVSGEAVMSAANMSAVRTSLSDSLNALALQLAQLVENPNTATNNSAQRAIMDARTFSPAMFNRDLIDLGEFARRLAEDARLPDPARQAAAAVREALNGTIIEEGHSVYRDPLSGMSVYVPSLSIPARFSATRAAAEGYWDEFIVALLFGVPSGGPRPTLQVLSPAEGSPVARRFSASVAASAASATMLTVQYKASWGDFLDIGSGLPPLQVGAVLDAGRDSGPALLTFRVLDGLGRPSASIERLVDVEAYPVTLAPALAGLALAVNRTTTVTLVATPRMPFQTFDIAWLELPAGVSGAGTTNFVSLSTSPPPPFNITLVLAAGPTALEGNFAGRLVVRPSASPSVVTFLDLALEITRPLPDLVLAPLTLSNDLPLPAEVVTATTRLSNLGFENVSLARVVAAFTDAGGNLTELSNTTMGPLSPGDFLDLTFNFTAERGTQRLSVRALPEPAVEELSPLNNAQGRTVIIVNLSVALATPISPVPAALGNATVPVPITVHNLGIDNDTYDLTVANLSHLLLQVGLPSATVAANGRSDAQLTLDALLPPTAEGGDAFTFRLFAVSQTDSNISASIVVALQVAEVFNASVRAQPNEVTLSAGGSSEVTVLLRNLGNGHESFALAVQGGDLSLGASLDQSDFVLAPGAAASPRLSLADGGLVSADRPYTLELVAVSQTSGLRFSAILSLRVAASPSLLVEPLEPRLQATPSGQAEFHARVTNTGNTDLLAALSAASAQADLLLNLSQAAVLLEPGESAVVNGTAAFAAPPLAGTYSVNVSAADALDLANATASFEIAVPAVHDLRAGVTVAPSAGPRALVRTITIENRGNTPELVTVVVGYVPPPIGWQTDPSNQTVVVNARQNFTITARIDGPANEGASGAIEVVLRSEAAGAVIPLSVAYDFAAPPSSPLPAWLAVIGAAGAALAAWVYVTGPRRPSKPPEPPGAD